MESNDMKVTKRNGNLEEIAFDKILMRVKKLGLEANIHINYQQLVNNLAYINPLYKRNFRFKGRGRGGVISSNLHP